MNEVNSIAAIQRILNKAALVHLPYGARLRVSPMLMLLPARAFVDSLRPGPIDRVKSV